MDREYQHSEDHVIISGVCTSLSKLFNTDVSVIRLIFLIFGFITFLTPIYYIIATLILKPSHSLELKKRNTNRSFFYTVSSFTVVLIFSILMYFDFPLFVHYLDIPFGISIFIQLFVICLFLSIVSYKYNLLNLKKNNEEKLISGVLFGISTEMKTSPQLIRLAFTFLILMFHVSSIVLLLFYGILALITKNKETSEMEHISGM